MTDSIEFEESSGNLYADLGLSDAKDLHLKAMLGIEIFSILQSRGLSQTEAAELLGVKQPDLSRLQNGKFSHYSIGRLIGFLNKLDRKVELRVSRHKEGDDYQSVTHL